MKVIKYLLMGVFVVSVASCAFKKQEAELNPVVEIATSQIGQGQTVLLKVLDERASKSLGRRGTAYGAAAEITAKEELADIVQQEIAKGLRRKGFTVVDSVSDVATNQLVVEIRTMEYSTSQGFWTGGVHLKGALKGRASKSKNSNKNFEQMYRYEREERVAFVPGAKKNERWINEALAETLKKLINDRELLTFLSSE